MKEVKVTFEAAGYITQIVSVPDDFDEGSLAALLERGVLATTIQEGGTLEDVATGNVIGKVVDVDNELDYSNFEVEGNSILPPSNQAASAPKVERTIP